MSRLELKQEFPCGYKVEFIATGGILSGTPYIDVVGECPIHGKNCIRLIKRKGNLK